ncbi:chemotaxis-specific protein-glutamate methyltransferase CheB [Halosolutus amylolyticus]|uniref:Protein-glutamate methylesterase/protein-glutamine glutaminase n=1 Tax=Halosolutus amylolyticus TaxID=2932267 RepID=A0ABD5PT46_9EURY|nr:chemotaxis-specific protein-glutamate methyltransferase CheB [Halosolutus amylolyticus]
MTGVLVVDDSQFMRTVIGNALSDAGYDVETASNGAEAIDAVAEYDPDVVTMDVEMPELGGIEAVERIMATNPTLILMLSAYTESGTEATLDALERGAVEFLHKPDPSNPGSKNIAHLAEEVVETVDELADADVSSLALARAAAAVHSTSSATDAVSNRSATPAAGPVTESGTATASPGAGPTPAPGAGADPDAAGEDEAIEPVSIDDEPDADPTIVIGASTGGPKIVERLFTRLPAALGATVLVVQHMPVGFTGRFADRLDSLSEYDVREASDGDRIGPGEAAVAPGDHHLEVARATDGSLVLRLDDGPRIHGVRPAIDVTMETAAEAVADPLCGVVLTGMGRDGAGGIEAISAAGGHTIAQDEATSPVFGIPCQAIETGCIDEVAPASEIVDEIVDAFATDGENDD